MTYEDSQKKDEGHEEKHSSTMPMEFNEELKYKDGDRNKIILTY